MPDTTDAIHARAFRYLIQRGQLRPGLIEEAKDAARAEIRNEHLMASLRCAACGEPSGSSRWCSDACRIAEDGPQPDEIPEQEAA